MEQYRVFNEQPIPEQLYFWKYSDYRNKKRAKKKEYRVKTENQNKSLSKSPIKIRQSQEPKLTTQEKAQQEELAQCTFKPQLISKNNRYWNQNETDFLQRCEMWQEQKEAKIARHKILDIENQLKECTFQPKISEYNFKVTQNQTIQNIPTFANLTQPILSSILNNNIANNNYVENEQFYLRERNKSPIKQKYTDLMSHLHKQLHQ